MTPEQKQLAAAKAAADKLKLVNCAPVKADPFAIDWEYHECGYARRTKPDGKPLPNTGPNAEPAWRWTEDPSPSGRPSMASYIKDLLRGVYVWVDQHGERRPLIGHRHNPIELHTEGGFPDWLFWGASGPGLIIRELKKMDHDWQRGQKQHLLSLQEAGQDADVWYPCCILSGRVDEELAALAGVAPKGTYARTRSGQANRTLDWKAIADGALSA